MFCTESHSEVAWAVVTQLLDFCAPQKRYKCVGPGGSRLPHPLFGSWWLKPKRGEPQSNFQLEAELCHATWDLLAEGGGKNLPSSLPSFFDHVPFLSVWKGWTSSRPGVSASLPCPAGHFQASVSFNLQFWCLFNKSTHHLRREALLAASEYHQGWQVELCESWGRESRQGWRRKDPRLRGQQVEDNLSQIHHFAWGQICLKASCFRTDLPQDYQLMEGSRAYGPTLTPLGKHQKIWQRTIQLYIHPLASCGWWFQGGGGKIFDNTGNFQFLWIKLGKLVNHAQDCQSTGTVGGQTFWLGHCSLIQVRSLISLTRLFNSNYRNARPDERKLSQMLIRQTERWKDEWIDGETERGWMEKWRDGCRDGWMYRIHVLRHCFI